MCRILSGLLLLTGIGVGCAGPPDRHQSESRTYANLELWYGYVKSTRDAGIDLAAKKTAKEAADFLRDKKVASEYEHSLLSADAWGRPYKWAVTRTGDETTL